MNDSTRLPSAGILSTECQKLCDGQWCPHLCMNKPLPRLACLALSLNTDNLFSGVLAGYSRFAGQPWLIRSGSALLCSTRLFAFLLRRRSFLSRLAAHEARRTMSSSVSVSILRGLRTTLCGIGGGARRISRKRAAGRCWHEKALGAQTLSESETSDFIVYSSYSTLH